MTDMYVHTDNGETSTGTPGDAPSNATAAATATIEKFADEATDLKAQAGEEVGSVVDAAKEQALSLADEAKMRMKDEADSATIRVADVLSGTAQELTSMASGVEDPGPAAQLVRQAGMRVDDVAERVRRDGYEGVARDVSRWARHNPGLFLLAAAGTGFLVGRVFRTVDTKGVAEAARGNGSVGSSLDDNSPQAALPSGSAMAGNSMGTAPAIASMSPSPDAVPSFTPQPHPDTKADPVLDLSGTVEPSFAPGTNRPEGKP